MSCAAASLWADGVDRAIPTSKWFLHLVVTSEDTDIELAGPLQHFDFYPHYSSWGPLRVVTTFSVGRWSEGKMGPFLDDT